MATTGAADSALGASFAAGPLVAVGIGASGEDAAERVTQAQRALPTLPGCTALAHSARYANPACGGVTRAPFVNAATLLCSALPPETLLRALFAVEWRAGRLRAALPRNSARTLDLDVLWWTGPARPHAPPLLPHPRLHARPFALVPLVEVLRAWAARTPGFAAPPLLIAQAARLDRSCLIPVDAQGRRLPEVAAHT